MPLSLSIDHGLDALSAWRARIRQQVSDVESFMAQHQMDSPETGELLSSLKERIRGDRLVVAFVAEFSRGKSELINALFFGDAGQRLLPATPGRTTMCPVEIAWDPEQPAGLSMLPIDTRASGLTLAEMKERPQQWEHRGLPLDSAATIAGVLSEVTRTQWVTAEEAQRLGFWDDSDPNARLPQREDGLVEVPLWRHALINYPHPLLRQGLVVLDTPGLNAIGAEPELTLSLLPTAHATVFVLGADTGVTQSDLDVWRDHLGTHLMARYVVLNKIDALMDPLSSPAEIESQIQTQQSETARALNIPVGRVFPVSARQALAAKIRKDAPGLAQSRLQALETAMVTQLLPHRRHMVELAVLEAADKIQNQAQRWLNEQRRQVLEQMEELKGLQGKSASRVSLMLHRLSEESDDFERCTALIQAMRVVHGREFSTVMTLLSSSVIKAEVDQLQTDIGRQLLNRGARKAFGEMALRLRERLDQVQAGGVALRELLMGSYNRLNAEFGFALYLEPPPDLSQDIAQIDELESDYHRYLGLTQALRLSQPAVMSQFRRMLISRLKVQFDKSLSRLDLWNRNATALVDAQLRERRKTFKRRRASLERIRVASEGLDQRLVELAQQDKNIRNIHRQFEDQLASMCTLANGVMWLDEKGDGQSSAMVNTQTQPEGQTVWNQLDEQFQPTNMEAPDLSPLRRVL